jgi:hypothetical protein
MSYLNYFKGNLNSDILDAIKQVVYSKTKNTISLSYETNYYDVVPIIKKMDKYGKWSLNPLFDMIKIYLMLPDKANFPMRWNSNKKVNLYDLLRLFRIKKIFFSNSVSIFLKL